MTVMEGPSKEGAKVATFIRSEFSAWQVILVEPKETAYLPLRRFTTILAVASLAMLALGWLATYLTARRLTVPLKRLQKALIGMDAANLVDTQLETPDIGHSSIREIDELAFAFNDMYEKLRVSTKDLVETRSEEMKAHMLALQSLMNPHFIYNNLAAIGAMADEGLTDEIKNMCDDVSQILRYVSADAANGVTLGEEIDHCEKYLKCMKIRHGDHLSYTIEVPDEMLGIVVPKLVIQPLVENSIKHGFEVSGPWRVSVLGRAGPDEWRIEVSDNGIGFDPDAIKRLYAQLEEWAESGKLPPLRIDGMGLLNIGLRLRLLYGEDHLFDIAEEVDGGARVSIGGRIRGR
jgi:two-component system sensor histidine kinase YesM